MDTAKTNGEAKRTARIILGNLPFVALAAITHYWWPLLLLAAFWTALFLYTRRGHDAAR